MDHDKNSSQLRRPEIVLPASVVIFLIVVWPLWRTINAYLLGMMPSMQLLISTLYFGVYIWFEFIIVGCRITDPLVLFNSVQFGVLASATLLLFNPPVSSFLEGVGCKYAFLLVLIPLFLLITELQVFLRRHNSTK